MYGLRMANMAGGRPTSGELLRVREGQSGGPQVQEEVIEVRGGAQSPPPAGHHAPGV